MEEQLNESDKQDQQTGMEKITQKLIESYLKTEKVDKKVISKLSNFSLNYIYYILAQANQIAEFQQTANIEGEQVKIAMKSINKKINLVKKEDAMKISQENLKNFQNHNLNTDESKLIRFNQSKNTRKYFIRKNETFID